MKKEMPKTKTFLNPNPYFHAIDVEVTFVTPYNVYFQLLKIIKHVRLIVLARDIISVVV